MTGKLKNIHDSAITVGGVKIAKNKEFFIEEVSKATKQEILNLVRHGYLEVINDG